MRTDRMLSEYQARSESVVLCPWIFRFSKLIMQPVSCQCTRAGAFGPDSCSGMMPEAAVCSVCAARDGFFWSRRLDPGLLDGHGLERGVAAVRVLQVPEVRAPAEHGFPDCRQNPSVDGSGTFGASWSDHENSRHKNPCGSYTLAPPGQGSGAGFRGASAGAWPASPAPPSASPAARAAP